MSSILSLAHQVVVAHTIRQKTCEHITATSYRIPNSAAVNPVTELVIAEVPLDSVIDIDKTIVAVPCGI